MYANANQNDSQKKKQPEAALPAGSSPKSKHTTKLSAARKAQMDEMTISELELLEMDGESEAVKAYAKERVKALKSDKEAKEKKDKRVGKEAAGASKELVDKEWKGSANPDADKQKKDMDKMLEDSDAGAEPSYADAKAETGGDHKYDPKKDNTFAGSSNVALVKGNSAGVHGENDNMKEYKDAKDKEDWDKEVAKKQEADNASLGDKAKGFAGKQLAAQEINLYTNKEELQSFDESKEGDNTRHQGTAETQTDKVDIKGGGLAASREHKTETVADNGYKLSNEETGYEEAHRVTTVTDKVSGSGSLIDPETGKFKPSLSAEAEKSAEYQFYHLKKQHELSESAKIKGEGEVDLSNASAEAKGSATWNPEDGLKVKGSAGASYTLVGGSYKFTFGPYDFKLLGEPMKAEFTLGASAKAVAEANGEVEINAAGGDNGVDVSFGGSASAFAGAKAGVEAGAKLHWAKKPEYRQETKKFIDDLLKDASWFSWLPDSWEESIKSKAGDLVATHVIGEGGLKELVALKAGVEGSAGIGGEASFNLGLSGGKFRCSGTLKGTVGLGVGGKVNLAIDMIEGFRYLGIMLFNKGADIIANTFGISRDQIMAEVEKRIDKAKKDLGKSIYEMGQDSWIPGSGWASKKAAAALGYEV